MFLMHLLLFTLTYMRGTYTRPSTHTLHFHKEQGERNFLFASVCLRDGFDISLGTNIHMNFLIDFVIDIDIF